MILEAKVNGEWVAVSWWIFRSWTGGRRVNGRAFHGRAFYLGQTAVARPSRHRSMA